MNAGRLIAVVAPFAVWFGAQSCTDNPAAYQGLFDPSREPSEGSGTSSGGTDTGGTGGSTGGSPSTSTGGTPGGEGGMGEGGMGKGGTGGGTGGTAGGTVNPPPHPDFSPACFLSTTESGEEILKGTPCTSADIRLCYRPCGPNQIGWKTEECIAGVYAEGDCMFPDDTTYECYAIPDEIDLGACGITAAPAATEECTAPLCMPCNLDGFYEDTGHDAKEGYCVCREPDATGRRQWTCASTTAWPCPFSRGC